MVYLIITLLLFVLLLLYFRIADHYNIIDKPNGRSSHTEITLRGGGIVFWFAALFYFILHIETNGFFFTALTLVGFISFYDDVKSLPNKLRLSIQLLAISIVFYDLGIFEALPWWGTGLAYILSVGVINVYNFMDGINGITGLYTIAVLASLLYVNEYILPFCDRDFLIFPILASAVFLFFNYRKKAKCFAGDIGSISAAFWVIYLLITLIIKSGSGVWILFLAVYGVDAALTILHRLYLRQNIFNAHRLHYYQILCNERKLSHRIVSLGYATLQIGISLFVILSYERIIPLGLFAIVLIPLVLIYMSKPLLQRARDKNVIHSV